MAKVTHRAAPPLTARDPGAMPVFAATGTTATTVRFVVATRIERHKHLALGAEKSGRRGAQFPRLKGEERAWRKELRREERVRTCDPPKAWTRNRIGETHATHRCRTTGATDARKSEAATTGRHAPALHARERSDGESGQDEQASAVGTHVSPTASEKAEPAACPCACRCLHSAPLPFAMCWLLRRRQTWHRLVRLEQ
eukprot:5187197-Pleurochrysis_carterae.AAC.1